MTCVRVGAGRCLRHLRCLQLRGEPLSALLLYVMTAVAAVIVLAALAAMLVGTG
ncbi:hypothetical protein [Streptomyces sp. NPDC051909]|uniref:hypothetical protein n=1 Tax=Streptomyces sp. NPDC051909 TaxID=3154944 RepID=UPI0034172BE6